MRSATKCHEPLCRKEIITTGNLDAQLLPYRFAILSVSLVDLRKIAWQLIKILIHNNHDQSMAERPFCGLVAEV